MENNFKFFTEIEVRISDINYGGHLGNDRYLSLFHDARIRFLKQLGCSEGDIGNGVGLTMSEAHINFKAEALLGDVLKIGVRITEIKPVKFLMEYIIERPADNKLIAAGNTRMVGYDYRNKKVCSLPQEFVDKLTIKT